MTKPVKWGIISTADIRPEGHPGAHASDKIDLVAVASRDQVRAEDARGSGSPARVRSYDELLADPELEAVSRFRTRCTASGRSRRSRPASTCSCEKPLYRHPDEVSAAFDAADQHQPAPQRGVHVPPQPRTKRLKELVTEGAVGELRLVRSVFSYSLYDHDNIRLRTDVEGGPR